MSEDHLRANWVDEPVKEMPPRLFVHANNVHQGGGWTLLQAVLRALGSTMNVTVILDQRMVIPQGAGTNVTLRRVRPTILHRLAAELWNTLSVRESDVVLCFGNLPPLFPLRGKVVVFVQNRFVIDRASLAGFNWKTRFRIHAERWWFAIRASVVDLFIVQTPSMQATLASRFKLGAAARIRVLPFLATDESSHVPLEMDRANKTVYDFIYVASAGPHKNHRRLIEAWCLLAEEGVRPSLCITVDRQDDMTLCQWMDAMVAEHKLQLTNVGAISHANVLDLYGQAGALLYASMFESFGIPLIEARQAGLPIVAVERDYVRDILDPAESFDPESARSIARAVKRFMGIKSEPLQIVDATTFLGIVLGNDS